MLSDEVVRVMTNELLFKEIGGSKQGKSEMS